MTTPKTSRTKTYDMKGKVVETGVGPRKMKDYLKTQNKNTMTNEEDGFWKCNTQITSVAEGP